MARDKGGTGGYAILNEHEEQSAIVRWARQNGIDLLFSIPNGEHRHISVAKRLKAEGLQPGVPDLFLAIPRNGKHGMFIEVKTLKGTASPLQKAWINALISQGYEAVICRGFEEAKKAIERYLCHIP